MQRKDENGNSFFSSLIEKHKESLSKWALEQTKSDEKAKELIQEIYIKIFFFITKEHAKSSDIKSIDDYIWSIAWNTLKKITKKSNIKKEVSLDSPNFEYFKRNMPYIDPFFDDDNPVTDKSEEYAKLRHFILRLDLLEREISIMFYWDKMTMEEIASKLKISYYTVNNCVVRIKRMLKTLLSNDDVIFRNIARPKKLYVSCFGDLKQENVVESINDDIVKQNICLACFGRSKSITELLDLLGQPRPYLEPELQWLVNKGFIIKKKNNYQTQFFIFTSEVYKDIFYVFEKSESLFFELLVNKLVSKRSRIKSIGFYGSNWSFKKLLWSLIPNLIKYIFVSNIKEYIKIGDDGIDFQPVGYECLSNKDDIKQLYGEKYIDLAPWNKIGYQEFDDDILTFGVIQHGISYKNELSHTIVESGSRYNDLFVRLFSKKTTIKELGRVDREALDNMIRWGLWAYHDNEYIIPQFCVFTEDQHKALDTIFEEISLDLLCELVAFDKIKKIVSSYVDIKNEQLRNSLTYIISNLYTSTALRLAFYSNKLYKPINERECAYLSLMVTLKSEQIHSF